MKLYNFTANNYGEDWFVVASSRKKALKAILSALEKEHLARLKHITDEAKEYNSSQDKVAQEERWEMERFEREKLFANCCYNNKPPYEGGTPASIEEFEPGVPIFSERS